MKSQIYHNHMNLIKPFIIKLKKIKFKLKINVLKKIIKILTIKAGIN